MTTEELHNILDDEDKKLTVSELQEVVYQLKNDCFEELNSSDDRLYFGQANAFQICLDLLEHIKE